ncbi:hemolysin-III related-domain-containing protein [Penicillium desertorum]|uniref:Hemolysin-III related-domain-containing protein n=1 Tax=Penicillium desertorum TaxID=1303715 RepID=A0A9W9WDH3_9EURO|nr:hemolysin-III related-domain-containing protein [Penicillium desertorum]
MPLQWDQLPSWQRDNQYILSGYRTSSNSFIKSFASLIYLHNESVNIYSHLIPAVILSFFGISLYKALARRYTSDSTADTMALGCFLLGTVLCLGISATFHIVQNHSSHVARIANQLDYIGIVLLIVGSFIPSIFYGFYCHPNLQRVYLTMVCPHFSYRLLRLLPSAYCVRQKQCRRKTSLMKKACEYSRMCSADVCVGIRIRETGQVHILSADTFLSSQLNSYYPAPMLVTDQDLQQVDKDAPQQPI